MLVTTIVNTAVAPGMIDWPSGVFTIVSTGFITVHVIRPVSDTGAAFVALTVAVLFIAVQLCTLVTALTTAVNVAFGARLPTLQVNDCDPGAPDTVQFGVA